MSTRSIENVVSPAFRLRRSAEAFVSAFRVGDLLIAWFVLSPAASFYIRLPLDKSVVTFNRAVIVAAIALLLLKAWASKFGQPATTVAPAFVATRFELAWALVSAIALMNALFLANDLLYAVRLAVDTFLLPLVMFHLARYHFDARGRSRQILLGATGLAWFLFATGAFEFLTGANLFPYKGSELIRAGERRVNGPFVVDSSFGIISLMLFVILLSGTALFPVKKDRWGKLFVRGGTVAAAAAVLLPMFRSAAIALVVCFLIIEFAVSAASGNAATEASGELGAKGAVVRWFRRLAPGKMLGRSWERRRFAAIAVAVIVLAGSAAVATGRLSAAKRLSDPRNVIGRLITWHSAAAMALDNPLVGVGLSNYQWAFDQRYFWNDEPAEELLETQAADSPHSNLLWVASELGIVAFLIYVLANAYLVLIGWRAFRRAVTGRARVAAIAFLALLAAYWIPGLTLASGYYSDVNLYLFFLTGLLSNRSFTSGLEPEFGRPEVET